MNVTVKFSDETVRKARHLAVDEDKSLSAWLADLVEAEVARRDSRSPEPKSLAEAMRVPGMPDGFYEKEFPLADRSNWTAREHMFEQDLG